MKYSVEMIKNDYEAWCRGEIGTHTMSKRKYNAFKNRMNSKGLKKKAEHYQVRQKLPLDQYIASRKAYQRRWRRAARRRSSLRVNNQSNRDGELIEQQ